MGAWPEREAPAERIASVVLAVEKGMDSSIPFSVALCFFCELAGQMKMPCLTSYRIP
jgi:hypothetical protein